VDQVRIGLVVRRLRLRAGWRQVDLARRAAVSPETIRKVERGRLELVTFGQLERVVAALGGTADVYVRWHGGDLSRVLNERHAAMHEAMARRFRELSDWVAVPEVSFAVYGERGVIDVVAWHAATQTLLVLELKTELVDVAGLLGQVDRYRRLAPRAVEGRAWRPARVAVWVVVAPGRSNARRLFQHAALIRSALPDDGRAVAGSLAQPDRPLACLSFMPERALAPFRRDRRVGRRVRITRSPDAAGNVEREHDGGPASRER
jgi:transcriptional regulator with XRE-family HTH domain